MRRKLPTAIIIACLINIAGQNLSAEDTVTPTPVEQPLITTPPFSYNGMITSNGYTGSGSMIGDGVMATAAHLVYDEDTPRWVPVGLIRYYPQYNKTGFPSGTSFQPVSYYKWDEYSTRVQEDDSGPGLSTPNTFNLDFAVAYFSSSTNVDAITQHAELNIDEEGEVTIHRHPREKMAVGYPQDSENIPVNERGLMHLTPPGDYDSTEAIDNIDMPGYDFGGIWASVYYYSDLTTYQGQSGGPVYVRDDLDNWMMAGVTVGGIGSNLSLIRSIDENAWNGTAGDPGGIKQIIMTRNGDEMMRVDDLQASLVTSSTAGLNWTDRSSAESGYYIFRQENGRYLLLADLPANTQSFVDTTPQKGKVYHYRVQPYRHNQALSHTNLAPKSKPVSVNIPGNYKDAKDFLAADLLQLSTSGDSSWHVDAFNQLRAGEVHSLGSSSLFLDIIGPGTVQFDWSTSCEVNVHYNNNDQNDPNSQYFGLIYDALWLYLDGNQVQKNQEPVFLSGPVPDDPTGIISESGLQLAVPAGPHRIEWRYEKDPYTNEHQDTGFLDGLSWTPDPQAPYPVYGGYEIPETSWHGSHWFGSYEAALWPWVAHENLGWLYMLGGTSQQGLYFHMNDARLGYLYTTPSIWPFLYRPVTDSWVFYFLYTGVFGDGCVFYDFETATLFNTGP